VAGLGAAWALATPVFASPDEPSHVVRAWSVVHGTLLGDEFRPHQGPPNPLGETFLPHDWTYGMSVRAPEAYRDWGNIRCLAFAPTATADCLALGSSTRSQPVLTYTGRYFPPYYLVVGLPTLLSSPGADQIYLMRFVAVALSAAFLASALASARASRAPLAAVGTVVAITPAALFFAATVNPSGTEIAAAIALWSTGALLVERAERGDVDSRVIDRLGVAAVALAVVRPLGPLWLAIAFVALAILAGRAGVAHVTRMRRARWWGVAIVAATVTHLVWNLWAQVYDDRHYVGSPTTDTATEIVRTSVGKGFGLLREMIGIFGWLDTPSPALTVVLWVLVLGGVVGIAACFASRRRVLVVLGLLVGTVVVPIVFEASQARGAGYLWQGRYTLPLAVGIPVVAGFTAGAGGLDWSTVRARVGLAVALALGVAQSLAFLQALRRYTVGANGTVWFSTRAAWEPPVPSVLMAIAFVALVAVFMTFEVCRAPRAALGNGNLSSAPPPSSTDADRSEGSERAERVDQSGR
jgi:hypothetical protein